MKKRFSLIFLFLSIAITYSASASSFSFRPVYNYDKNELVSRLKTTKTDTGKLNLLISLAFDNNMLVESPSFIDTGYVKQIISINEQANLLDDTPFRTLLLALREGIKTNFPAEITLLKKTVDQFDKQDIEVPMLLIEARWIFNAAKQQEEKYRFYTQKVAYYLQKGQYNNAAACYHCLAGYYVFKSDYNSSINNYLKAGELFKSFSHLWYMHEFIIVAGEYDEWGNVARSQFYFKKALAVKNPSGKDNDMFGALAGLAKLECGLRNYKASLSYIEQVEKNSPLAVQNWIGALKALDLVGLNRLDEALSQLNKIKKDQDQTGLSRAILNTDYTPDYAFYKYYVATGNYKKAETYLLNAYNVVKTDNNIQSEITYLKALGQLYAGQKETSKALEYTTLYNSLSDSLQAKTKAYNIASYENQQKENEQNRKVTALRQQQAVQEATLAQRNTIIWLSLIGLAVVLASLVFIYRQLRINKRNLAHLKITQTQLIQSEKMASLGELTAGIAHEIQNPLNFVNNFSEVSIELLAELKDEEEKGNKEDVIAIADDLSQNLEKIRHHGKRADGIVKGMLEHSKASSGQKEPTDLNALADEYLRLAYHGLRTKDREFNAELITNFDEKLPRVTVIPQDMGRVMLNLFNNAFYAVNQKQKTAGTDYKPEVCVSTSATNGQVIIKVKDNGVGIPNSVKDKIMQPFFTTKPTGEGTGLGLSLSYDILVKGHGGTINMDSREGEGTEFTVTLPL